jgi:hypothetical protein
MEDVTAVRAREAEEDDAGTAPACAAEAEGFSSFVAIAAELGRAHTALAEVAPGADAGAEHRLLGKIRDLEEMLARQRPEHPREALVAAAVAAGLVQQTDELGGYVHGQALKLIARVLEYLEASAGVTAASLGLGRYTATLADGPDVTTADLDAAFLDTVSALDALRAGGRS